MVLNTVVFQKKIIQSNCDFSISITVTKTWRWTFKNVVALTIDNLKKFADNVYKTIVHITESKKKQSPEEYRTFFLFFYFLNEISPEIFRLKMFNNSSGTVRKIAFFGKMIRQKEQHSSRDGKRSQRVMDEKKVYNLNTTLSIYESKESSHVYCLFIVPFESTLV